MARKSNVILNNVLPERKCAVCGKKLCRVCWENYAYKDGAKVYCGYNCMRKAHKTNKCVRRSVCSD